MKRPAGPAAAAAVASARVQPPSARTWMVTSSSCGADKREKTWTPAHDTAGMWRRTHRPPRKRNAGGPRDGDAHDTRRQGGDDRLGGDSLVAKERLVRDAEDEPVKGDHRQAIGDGSGPVEGARHPRRAMVRRMGLPSHSEYHHRRTRRLDDTARAPINTSSASPDGYSASSAPAGVQPHPTGAMHAATSAAATRGESASEGRARRASQNTSVAGWTCRVASAYTHGTAMGATETRPLPVVLDKDRRDGGGGGDADADDRLAERDAQRVDRRQRRVALGTGAKRGHAGGDARPRRRPIVLVRHPWAAGRRWRPAGRVHGTAVLAGGGRTAKPGAANSGSGVVERGRRAHARRRWRRGAWRVGGAAAPRCGASRPRARR